LKVWWHLVSVPARAQAGDTTKRRLIEMMWGYFDSGNWLWMGGVMVLLWGAIVVLAVFAFRTFAWDQEQ
jgi:hypothetical protein